MQIKDFEDKGHDIITCSLEVSAILASEGIQAPFDDMSLLITMEDGEFTEILAYEGYTPYLHLDLIKLK